jgi:hypothetical protein
MAVLFITRGEPVIQALAGDAPQHDDRRIINYIGDGAQCWRRIMLGPFGNSGFALRDNRLAWLQQPDGSYSKLSNRRAAFKLHEHLMGK